MSAQEQRVTAVMITHNRRDEMLRSLNKLSSLPEAVPIILVDNGSTDDSAAAVSHCFPHVTVIRSNTNLGAAARNLGAERANTPYVALTDDDTWWADESLRRAADLLDDHPNVAVLTARLLNGPEQIEDPVCQVLQASPVLARGPVPGQPILGFLAGASVVRRDAFLDAGGFDPRFFIGGEEELLALELAVRGWALCYVPELIVHHYPSSRRDSRGRSSNVVRNRLWVSWLRRPARAAWSRTLDALRTLPSDGAAARGVLRAVAGLPWVLRERRVVPPDLEEQLLLLEGG
jgi:GT2 family glycosyltransferase